MSKHSLTQRRVDNVKSHPKQYQITDRKIKGLFLRVYPARKNERMGRKNWFLRLTHQGEAHFINIGDAARIPVEKARITAAEHIARIRAAPNKAALFEHVAAEFFERYSRNWKPSTLRTNRQYYRNNIKPYFAGRTIESITYGDVQTWHASLSAIPGAANTASKILSVMMREAEHYGYRKEGTNPCFGMKRYRAPKRERYLDEHEIKAMGDVLRRYEADHPDIVAAIKLLMLTGCRKNEILALQWRWYRDGCLHLPDTKTGPRIIYLCSAARKVLADLRKRRKASAKRVFPTKSKSAKYIYGIWVRIRSDGNFGVLRLHDLRHTYASHALRHGENVRVISHLLGHRSRETTLKYLHLADSSMAGAVEHINKTMLNPEQDK